MSLPRDGLCFCRRGRLLLSSRFTGRGAPMAVRAMDFTSFVAVNFFGFFFRGIRSRVNHSEYRGPQKKFIPIEPL